MGLQLPTTQEIADQLMAHFNASYGQDAPILPQSNLRVLAEAIAGVSTLNYKYMGWVYLQGFVDTCDEEALELHGNLVAETRANAVSAVLDLTVTGTDGLVVPIGTKFINEYGTVYVSKTEIQLASGTGVIEARCSEPGAIGNLEDGSELDFVQPIIGVEEIAIVASTDELGVDRESVAEYRKRVKNAYKKVRRGGNYADYEAWGLEPVSVRNIYPYSGDIAGHVDVYVESGVETDGIPAQSELDAVDLSIHQSHRKPISDKVNVLPITRTAFKIVIYGLSDDTTENRVRIENAWSSYLLDREPYIMGLSGENKSVISHTDLIALANEALKLTGASFTDVIFYINEATGNLVEYGLQPGEKCKLNVVVYG